MRIGGRREMAGDGGRWREMACLAHGGDELVAVESPAPVLVGVLEGQPHLRALWETRGLS